MEHVPKQVAKPELVKMLSVTWSADTESRGSAAEQLKDKDKFWCRVARLGVTIVMFHAPRPRLMSSSTSASGPTVGLGTSRTFGVPSPEVRCDSGSDLQGPTPPNTGKTKAVLSVHFHLIFSKISFTCVDHLCKTVSFDPFSFVPGVSLVMTFSNA